MIVAHFDVRGIGSPVEVYNIMELLCAPNIEGL